MAAISGCQYILYARPRGHIGKALNGYWDKVKASKDLNHLFFRQYPPHVSLTSFFTAKEVKKVSDLNNALDKAIAKTKMAHDVKIKGLKTSSGFDRLELESKFLLEVTKRFATLVALPAKKAKKGIDEPLHLTLKKRTFKKDGKNQEIQKLEIGLMKEIGKDSGKWSLCLYKSEMQPNNEMKLTLCKKVDL